MKKWYVKYKIMLNGFSVNSKYEIDGFALKTGIFEKEKFNNKYNPAFDGIDIDLYKMLYFSCSDNYKDLTYRYLESTDYKEIEVSNKIISKNINKLIEKNKHIINDILEIQNKMRIIYNIPVLFQCINAEFYDENKKFVNCYQVIFPLTSWNRLSYDIDPIEFSNNSRFKFDFNAMKSLNNNQFKRATELFNDSFESIKISSRFLLLFSAIEAIFNLDAKDIADKLAKYTAKLLSEDVEELYDIIFKDMKSLYNKRSDYIHGRKSNCIKDKDEKLLRKYVRKIILIYWMMSLNTNMNSKKILEYLDSNEKLDIQTKIFISATMAKNFDDQQHRLINLVEKEFNMKIPEETKALILSNCHEK